MLDTHVSVEQLMSTRNLKNDSILIICVLKSTMLRLIRGGALSGGRGGNLPSPLMAFFTIHVIDIFTTY